MSKIKGHDTLIQTLTSLSEGNPNALSVLVQIMREGDKVDPSSIAGSLGAVMVVDQLQLYGPLLWVLYKDLCDQDIIQTLAVLRAVQLGLLPGQAVVDAVHESENVSRPHARLDFNAPSILDKVRARLPNFGRPVPPETDLPIVDGGPGPRL